MIVPTANRINIISVTMINAARNAGIRRCCIHSIGRTVMSARNTAIKNGTSSTLAICRP